MKFQQIGKRIFLMVLVNILVVTTITIILAVLRVGNFFPMGGLGGLFATCLVWGFVGAFISLGLSRIMAKWLMGVKVVPAETTDPKLRWLVETVHHLARAAGLPALPEVGIYESPEVNAFATGPTKSRSLVAVSTGLLENMGQAEVEGVLGHELTHISNGDMVTMTLLQGVINAFVMFLARVLAFVVSQALRSRDDGRDGGGFMEFIMYYLFQIVFSLFGYLVLAWFSRIREFRADAGGARLAGRNNMIGALRVLGALHDERIAAAEAQRGQAFRMMKISGPKRSLFADHPSIEERIARLEAGPA